MNVYHPFAANPETTAVVPHNFKAITLEPGFNIYSLGYGHDKKMMTTLVISETNIQHDANKRIPVLRDDEVVVPIVAIDFYNIDQLNVVIRQLNRIKKSMRQKEKENENGKQSDSV